jgi:two-component system, chemotaxis family, response regulator WspR
MNDLQMDDVKTDENAAMVLLVDDQAMIGEAVRRGLALEQNIDFHFCADPHQAIAQAIRIKPTVILQDLVMPGLDGLTWCANTATTRPPKTSRSSCCRPKKTR